MRTSSRIVKEIDQEQCAAVKQVLQRIKREKQYSALTELMLGDGRSAFVGLSSATQNELAELHLELARSLSSARPFASCEWCGEDAPCRRPK